MALNFFDGQVIDSPIIFSFGSITNDAVVEMFLQTILLADSPAVSNHSLYLEKIIEKFADISCPESVADHRKNTKLLQLETH